MPEPTKASLTVSRKDLDHALETPRKAVRKPRDFDAVISYENAKTTIDVADARLSAALHQGPRRGLVLADGTTGRCPLRCDSGCRHQCRP